jgi:hypothetical protein
MPCPWLILSADRQMMAEWTVGREEAGVPILTFK